MLKMNRKKRKASGSRATNSNQKYFTFSWKDAVEVGEMVTMDHGGTSVVDFDEDGEHLDYVLPKELLLLVLARLPVPDITRLRSLSKEWNRDMATANSEINRALDENSPAIIAGFSLAGAFPHSEFIVEICTQRSQYSYRLHPGNPNIREDGWHAMGAMDGGLVCFASTWRPSKANPLCLVVVNLLTRVRRKLPPLQYVYFTPPKMMHIKVDPETKCYRVVVIGKNIKGRPTVEIYDSGARQWTKAATPPLGSIFGLAYSWEYYDLSRRFDDDQSPTRSLYDFAEGQLKCCDEQGPSGGAYVITYTYHQDCKFVLHNRNTSNAKAQWLPAEGYWIAKYRSQNSAKDWVHERSYMCSPHEAVLDNHCCAWTLEAFADFLKVITYSSGGREHHGLLDLATGEWSDLPYCFQGLHFRLLMSRAFWNVVPYWIVYVQMH